MVKKTIFMTRLAELREAIRKGDYAQNPFPSEAQLMKKFSIGRQTAVRILNALADEGLIVRRRGSGNVLSRVGQRSTGRIGLIVHGGDYCEIFTPISKAISLLSQKHGYTLLFGDVSSHCTSRRIRRVFELARKFLETGLDGLIFQPIELIPNADRVNAKLADMFSRAGVPIVLLDSDIVDAPDRSAYDLVSVDHFSVGRRLAGHLRSRGARRVVYLTQENRAPCVKARQLGIRVGCEGCELPGKEVYAYPDDVQGIKAMLRRERPDAIACYNDRQAALLLQTLSKLGKRVPEDVLVAGFDDVQFAKLTIPPLTTMHQPCDEIAASAFGLLLDRIRKPNLPPRSVILDSPLVVRGSTS